MEFSCVNCLPVRKVLKTTSQGPVSNLKGHLISMHPHLIDRFKAVLGCKQRKSKKKIGTVNIEDPHNFEFEDLAIKYKYIEDFFSLQSTELKENGRVSMEFSCVNCLPAKIVITTRKRVPVWGLKYGVKLEEILVYNSEKYGTCFVTNPAELSWEIWGK